GRHAPPHDAEPDETDPLWHGSLRVDERFRTVHVTRRTARSAAPPRDPREAVARRGPAMTIWYEPVRTGTVLSGPAVRSGWYGAVRSGPNRSDRRRRPAATSSAAAPWPGTSPWPAARRGRASSAPPCRS